MFIDFAQFQLIFAIKFLLNLSDVTHDSLCRDKSVLNNKGESQKIFQGCILVVERAIRNWSLTTQALEKVLGLSTRNASIFLGSLKFCFVTLAKSPTPMTYLRFESSKFVVSIAALVLERTFDQGKHQGFASRD